MLNTWLHHLIWYCNRYEYHWADGKEIKKAIKVSPNEYAGYLFDWVKKQLDDQTIFPVKSKRSEPLIIEIKQSNENFQSDLLRAQFYRYIITNDNYMRCILIIVGRFRSIPTKLLG